MPDDDRVKDKVTEWAAANRPGQVVDCFLEGPSFDRAGNLYVTDIPNGRVFRISPERRWSLVAEYDGWPNGLKIHSDGRIFITDYRRGIVVLDPDSGAISPFLTHRRSEGFRGVNDLFFDRQGRIYFTDQGQTGIHDPTGRVYRYDPLRDALDCLIANGPSPNGLVMNPGENVLYVAMTRGNAVWRLPVFPDGGISKASIFVAMAGGVSGADGMAVDEAGNLYVADAGNGCVWSFSARGVPLLRIAAESGGQTCTNVAFGGAERRQLFITESDTGNILVANMEAAGQAMYANA